MTPVARGCDILDRCNAPVGFGGTEVCVVADGTRLARYVCKAGGVLRRSSLPSQAIKKNAMVVHRLSGDRLACSVRIHWIETANHPRQIDSNASFPWKRFPSFCDAATMQVSLCLMNDTSPMCASDIQRRANLHTGHPSVQRRTRSGPNAKDS